MKADEARLRRCASSSQIPEPEAATTAVHTAAACQNVSCEGGTKRAFGRAPRHVVVCTGAHGLDREGAGQGQRERIEEETGQQGRGVGRGAMDRAGEDARWGASPRPPSAKAERIMTG